MISINQTTEPGLEQVLVVGRSRITQVVVSEIVHKSGLRAASHSIEDAAIQLKSQHPRLVILDGGADNADCNTIYEAIAALRRVNEHGLPRVILLSVRNGTPESLSLPALIDQVIAKPITAERLQPAIETLAHRKG